MFLTTLYWNELRLYCGCDWDNRIRRDGRSMVGTWNGDATWTGTGTEIVAPLMPTNKDQCKKGDKEIVFHT